jgi:hypothetical protein
MRVAGLALLFVLGACSISPGSSATSTPSGPTAAGPSPQATCRLPVWWPENATSTGVDIHAAFVSIPDGAVTDAGVVPQLSLSLPGLASVEAYGATYESASNQWVHADRADLSPDGKRLAYWTSTGINDNSVHVLDLATGVDHLLYSGSTLFIVIAFEPEGIYLVHGIAPRQGAFEKLYLLDPAGGAPALVPGSDRHMYQYGWVLISDGAAWGIDFRVEGNAYIYSVVRLDLVTAQATKWLEGTPDDGLTPLGTDAKHRLYAGDSKSKLWRIGLPGQVDVLPNPGPVVAGGGLGASTSFASDSLGAWFAGMGGVWLYRDAGEPRLFAVGPQNVDVSPAGPCA